MNQTASYRVLTAFRVGRTQRWLKPSDEPVQLLPCQAQYPLRMGWLEPAQETLETTAPEQHLEQHLE